MPPAKKGKPLTLAASLLALLFLLTLYAFFPRKPSGEIADPATTFRGHRFPVQAVAFSLDGTVLTSAACIWNDPGEEMELFTWDARTGRRRLAPTDLQGYTLSLALTPDGKALAATASDGTVRVWDTISLTERMRFGTGRVFVSALAITPDGGWLATPDREGNVVLWDARGEPVWSRPGQERNRTPWLFRWMARRWPAAVGRLSSCGTWPPGRGAAPCPARPDRSRPWRSPRTARSWLAVAWRATSTSGT